MEEKIKNLIKDYEKFAQENGLKLNPDKKIVENIIKAMLKKEELLGERYCPCRRTSGDIEKDKDIICPCKMCTREVEDNGHCHCNLFVK